MFGGRNDDVLGGGEGNDKLSDETRSLVEADLDGGWFEYLGDIGVTTIGIENFVFVDSRLDLADAVSNGRVNEADLFGLV